MDKIGEASIIQTGKKKAPLLRKVLDVGCAEGGENRSMTTASPCVGKWLIDAGSRISEPPPKKWLLHLPRPKVADSQRADLALSRFQHLVGCFKLSSKVGIFFPLNENKKRAKHSKKNEQPLILDGKQAIVAPTNEPWNIAALGFCFSPCITWASENHVRTKS